MKKFILLGCLIAAVAAGFYINHRIKIYNFNEKLQTMIGKDQEMTETILKAESESSQMTYGELFEFCDKSVKERTEMLMELRGLYPDIESVLKDSLREFLNAENQLVRLKSQSYRKFLTVSTSSESYIEAGYRYRHLSYYEKEMRHKAIRELLEDANDMKDGLQTFMETYETVTEMEKSLEKLMKKEGLKFTPIFSKYQEANQAYVNTSLQYVELVKQDL